MRKTGCAIAILLALATGTAHASYLQECKLHGVVVDDPEDLIAEKMNGTEDERISFHFRIESAVRNGRDDSGCSATFGHKTIWVHLNGGFARHREIKKGDQLTLAYFNKNSDGMPQATETFDVIDK